MIQSMTREKSMYTSRRGPPLWLLVELEAVDGNVETQGHSHNPMNNHVRLVRWTTAKALEFVIQPHSHSCVWRMSKCALAGQVE